MQHNKYDRVFRDVSASLYTVHITRPKICHFVFHCFLYPKRQLWWNEEQMLITDFVYSF
jgi:hypothetical protein